MIRTGITVKVSSCRVMLKRALGCLMAGSLGLVAALPSVLVQAQDMLTLTQADGSTMTTGEDGFIRRWLVLEPISVPGQLTDSAVQEVISTEWFSGQVDMIPENGTTVTVEGETHTWHALDTELYNVNTFHFARALDMPTSNVLFWAVTIVVVPEDMHDVRLAIGSNAASHWWVNGEEVIRIYSDRQTVIDDGVSDRLTLHKGANVIRAAVINAGGATDFTARFLDENEQPVEGLEIDLTVRP